MFFQKEVYRATCSTVHVNSSFIFVDLTHSMFCSQDDVQGAQVCP